MRPLTAVQQQVRQTILAADNEADYEQVVCLCGVTPVDLVLAQADRYGLPYRKVICAACGLLRANPRWNEARFSRFYTSEYRDLYNPVVTSKESYARSLANDQWRKAIATWVEQSWQRSGRADKNVRIVEIGAGGGWNLSQLPGRWERIGYDVDDDYLALGKRLFGVTMHHGFVQEALEMVPTADIVLLSHVLEHFNDPRSTLEQITGQMGQHTLLCIEVPGLFRIHRTNFDVMSYMQNAHTYTFCAVTIQQLCEQVGLEVLSCDEIVRVVCRRRQNDTLQSVAIGSPKLMQQAVRYLQACERGYRLMNSFGHVPGVGRYLKAIWRRSYFPLLNGLVPRRGVL
jgi:hypothetical protein